MRRGRVGGLALIVVAIVLTTGCEKEPPEGGRRTRRVTGKTTPLHRAAEAGDIEEARALIAEGADVNAKASVDWTPLHRAADKGQVETASLLLARYLSSPITRLLGMPLAPPGLAR